MKHLKVYNSFLTESVSSLPTITSLVNYIKNLKNEGFYVKLDVISYEIWRAIHKNENNIRTSDYVKDRVQEFKDREFINFGKFFSVVRKDNGNKLYFFGNLTGHIKAEINIQEISDEYFFVHVVINHTNRINFKCDQAEGVLALMNDLKRAFELFSVVKKESIDYSDFFKVVDDEYGYFDETPRREKEPFDEYEKERILDCLAGWATTYKEKTMIHFSISSPVVNDTQKVFNIEIMKKKDEWFRVKFLRGLKKLNTNSIYGSLTEYGDIVYYNCDQIEGLIVCLEYIKKQYIKSPV